TIDCGATEEGKTVTLQIVGALLGENLRKIVPDTYTHMGLVEIVHLSLVKFMLRKKATLAPLRTGRGDKLSAPILIFDCSLWGRSGLSYLDERRDSQALPLGSPMVRRDDVLGAAEEIDRIDEIDDWKKTIPET